MSSKFVQTQHLEHTVHAGVRLGDRVHLRQHDSRCGNAWQHVCILYCAERLPCHVSLQKGMQPTEAACLCADNVPKINSPVSTFFEGSIVGVGPHTFVTGDWHADKATDWSHWHK